LGVRGADWFGFETKSHPNLKIKKACGLVQLILKKKKLNQTNATWVGSVVVFCKTIQFFVSNIKIKLKTNYFH